MNYAAIWHEATQRFCYCIRPGKFLFRLQTAKDDIKQVILHSRDKYLPLHIRDTRQATPMRKVACDGLRDYYEAELEFQVVCLRYYFEIVDEEGVSWFYSNDRFTRTPPTDIERFFDCPQTLREEEALVAEIESYIQEIGAFHRQKLNKAVVTLSLQEDYQVNDSNCYRIHRLEKDLFGAYAPEGFDCDESITYEWNESREKNLYGHFNFYFGITRDTISKSSMLLYMILLFVVSLMGNVLWELVGPLLGL